MGQAKRRGNMSERVELAFAWEEAYDEKWERERPLWAAEISRRQAAAYLMTPGATKKLFADIAPRFSDRAGGYTRIIHAGFRIGDGAQLAILELLGSKLKKKEKKEKAAAPEAAEEEKKEEKAGA